MYKSGLVVNPAFCWLGASPDGIIYDPSSNHLEFLKLNVHIVEQVKK